MSTTIKCPNCQYEFLLEAALSDEMKELMNKEKDQLRRQMIEYRKQKDEEVKKKEEEWQQRLNAEKQTLQKQVEEQIRKSVSADFENRMGLLQRTNADNEEKLRLSRQKELDFLKREQEFKTKEQELELTVQKKLSFEREKIYTELRKLETEKTQQRENEYQLRLRELEKQLEEQKKLASEMKRKAEQGSMQLQGEVQEIALEEMLAMAFPFDQIQEVGKGVRGADCIQIVRNALGVPCGTIIWESKRTEHFNNEWIEKLKADMRSVGADIAILVTQRFPREMDRFGEKDGVWICSISEAKALALILRDSLIKVYNASKNQENKGEKAIILYDYLTSSEFKEQFKAILETFMTMKKTIVNERAAMEKLWKAR